MALDPRAPRLFPLALDLAAALVGELLAEISIGLRRLDGERDHDESTSGRIIHVAQQGLVIAHDGQLELGAEGVLEAGWCRQGPRASPD